MKYYKISNYIKNDGKCDYKGMDITKFISGKQIYFMDDRAYCCIATDENYLLNSADVLELTFEEYEKFSNEARQLSGNFKTEEQLRIEMIEKQNEELTTVLGDLILGGAL